MLKTMRAPGRAEGARLDRIDALRGAALIWMAAFHFCFDLANWRLLDANFYTDPVWTGQRTCILSTFLLCAGAGQALATHQGQSWARFWRRWAQIVGCALLVSLGSWAMFPRSYITFGVLHGMAVMLIVARLTAPWRHWLWPLGALAMALPHLVTHPWFDTRATNWIGLVTHKPITEDHVPVLPWLGVMWWGLATTQWLLAHRAHWLSSPEAIRGDNHGFAWRSLVRLGQWSLTFYMVHQPVMLGLLAAGLWLAGRPIPM
ncbi:MAG: hypothetical protein RI907_2741 [Pseudomonadota bacterium]|jgi:uncharacterized membrane protein